MRVLYFSRVFLLSLEAVVLLVGLSIWINFPKEIDSVAGSMALNEEILKYIMVLPVALAVWVFNEIRTLLQEDKETIKILTAWPDYWKLKCHVWVALHYAVIFAVISISPWLVKSGITSGGGMMLFLISLLGQLVLSFGVYMARIRSREVLACL